MPVDEPTRRRALEILRTTFGFESFRPLQREIVESILASRDVFALMPTGGGKSLCYQLPALALEGVAIVISPLIALMKDQVDRLQTMGVAAAFLNSSQSPVEAAECERALHGGRLKLLYVAPERLMMPGFLQRLGRLQLSFFAVDEAHCVSEWGHDFRPEYRELRRLREIFPRTPLAAFTATATGRVQSDILSQLGLSDATTFRGNFNRSNLYYEVRPKQGAYEQIRALLRARPQDPAILYCQSRTTTERIAERLASDGIRAVAYHAGLDSAERRRRQEAFARDDARVVVATVAFGMGIDKPDVRFVIHYDLPRNLEGYYQESGRAGRDGEPSECILFYSYGDVAKHDHFITQKATAAERKVAADQLRRVVEWADGTECRRRLLLGYFDETTVEQTSRCCDICERPPETEDYTIPAQMLLSCAKRTGERFGLGHLIDVLRGAQTEKIDRFGHQRVSTYGIGAHLSQAEWQHLGAGLLRAGFIRRAEQEYNAIKVTETGASVLFRGVEVTLPKPRRAAKATPAAEDGEIDSDLFERLRGLRKRLADERRVPPYVVFSDATLRQMARALPSSPTEMLAISGVGEHKLGQFGAQFLAEISRHRSAPER